MNFNKVYDSYEQLKGLVVLNRLRSIKNPLNFSFAIFNGLGGIFHAAVYLQNDKHLPICLLVDQKSMHTVCPVNRKTFNPHRIK